MKKASHARKDELRPEYRREDLGKGVRGRYHRAYTKGTNLVLLSPNVANPTYYSHSPILLPIWVSDMVMFFPPMFILMLPR